MQTYRLDSEHLKASKITWLKKTLEMSGFYFLVCIAIDRIWSPRRSIGEVAFSALIWGAFMALFSYYFEKRLRKGAEISIDENEIRGKNSIYGRSVHRGKVATIIERKYGLLVSERSRFGTFLWGGIFIPKRLPEYAELKRLAESWKIGPAE